MNQKELDRLLERYQNDQCSAEEKLRIEEWLEKNTRVAGSPWHTFSKADKEAYMERLYARISDSVAAGEAASMHEIPSAQPWWRSPKWMVAASLIVVVSAYFVWKSHLTADGPEQEHWQTMVAKPGHQLHFTLADGTTVWLKGGSELRYPEAFNKKSRTVELQGEAFFEVTKNQHSSFVVKAGELETKVLGTAFNIQAFKDLPNFVVSLVAGKVAVQVHPERKDADVILLAPNEELVYNQQSEAVSKSTKTDMKSAGQYQSGDLQFEETTLDEVFFILGNAYGLEITYDEAQAKQQKMSGSFSLNQPVDEVFQSIAAITNGSFTRKDRKVIFSHHDIPRQP